MNYISSVKKSEVQVKKITLADFAATLLTTSQRVHNTISDLIREVSQQQEDDNYCVIPKRKIYALGYGANDLHVIAKVVGESLTPLGADADEIGAMIATDTVPLSELKKAVDTAKFYKDKLQEVQIKYTELFREYKRMRENYNDLLYVYDKDCQTTETILTAFLTSKARKNDN